MNQALRRLSCQLFSQDEPVYKIQIDQDGYYQLSFATLQSAGVPVNDINPQTLRVFNHNSDIPIYISGEGDGKFDPADSLFFYGQKTDTKYSDINVYWLTWGADNGLRMQDLDGSISPADQPTSFKTTMHIEENHEYWCDMPSGPNNDHWFWSIIDAYNAPASQDFEFQLHNLAADASSATLHVLIKGLYADPQHHSRILINGHLLDDRYWSSSSELDFSINFPHSYLVDGTNTITVELPRDNGITIDEVMPNWFEVDYYHTYTAEDDQLFFSGDDAGLWEFQVGGFSSDTIDVIDITDPSNSARIVNGSIYYDGSFYQIWFNQQIEAAHRYLAVSPSSWLTPEAITQDNSSNLRDPSNGADYIIISHSDFIQAIQPLANYRATQGLRVKVIDVQDVYDEFSGGVFDPQAIHDFLAYVYGNWVRPAPSYVLIVGDGHYDYLNNYGDSGPNYIPPYLGEFDPWIGETASDNRYVTVSGDDILPDMATGRLPANSAEETAAMVDKILYYEQNPAAGDWTTRVTFIADNADAGGNFPVLSDHIVDQLPEGYSADKVYYGVNYSDVTEARAAIINAINDGRLIVNYTGHGSTQLWASEKLLQISSISSLNNIGKYPFFVPMTCNEGYFIYPQAQGFNYPSLAESLVRASNRGAIASFSPMGFGLSNGHDLLASGLYDALFYKNLIQVGFAADFAKYYSI